MTEGTSPKRPFGLTSATCLVVANMIGAGVFTTSGFSLASLGSRRVVMLAWLVGGIIALCGAISYGGLVRRITESGGEYVFLSRVIHPLVGFLAGWVSLIAGFTGAIAFAATAFETYAVPESIWPSGLPKGSVAVAIVVLCGVMHWAIVKLGLIAQNLVVLAKLIFIVAFIVFGFSALPAGHWPGLDIVDQAAPFSIAVFASSLVWISLSYSGFNAAVYVAGEVADAKRNVPLALWMGTLTVALFYLALNFVFLYAPPPENVVGQPDVAAVAASAIGGTWLATLVRIAISLALVSSVSSMIVAGPRVYAQMARDGVFPQLFQASDRGDLTSIPRAAIVLQVVLATVVVCVSTLNDLLSYLGFTLSLSAAGTVICLFILRFREGSAAVPLVGYPLVPGLYVLATIGLAALAASDRPWQLAAAIVTILSGIVAYYLIRVFGVSAPSLKKTDAT